MKLLLCILAFAVSTQAQTLPKVVFVGDGFAYAWEQTPEFLSHSNWIGAATDIVPAMYADSKPVVTDFQANVIARHPAFVFIATGEADLQAMQFVNPNGPVWTPGIVWSNYQYYIQQMVAMAQQANIKVIIGNVPMTGYGGHLFNLWLGQYGVASNIPIVNLHDSLCQCVGMNDGNAPSLFTPPSVYEQPIPSRSGVNIMSVNPAGYALASQMAEIAIETYGLTIKSGYLSDVQTVSGLYLPLQANVNTIDYGDAVAFTPMAHWSDGVVRPLLNQDFNGLKGTWTSSNPFIMSIDQQGIAIGYGAFPQSTGKARISFTSATGIIFSPWDMTIELENGPPPQVP